jgi:hypothetical protein
MDTGIVETCENDSDWRGHAVLQKKKDGKTRFTCDFRHMGPETCEKYHHPLPLIQEILDNLRGAWYFTKIDFTDSYFHIPIKAKYRKHCNEYCKSCKLCQQRYTFTTKGLKLGRVFATRQNELIGMDLFCGLPESEAGYQNILVMTDYITKYVVAVPLFSKTANEVAQEFVDKWCLIHGWPERIQTDQGGEFTGNILQAITEAARVKKSTTIPYHPQANR